jgi:microcystin-dependent protein
LSIFPHLPVLNLEDVTADLEALQPLLSQFLYEPGDLKPTARTTPPEGWLLAEGQAVSRTTFAALFTAIGVTYGEGDKTTTFNVPDAKNRALIGAGVHALGAKGGEETVTLTTGQMPKHLHNQGTTTYFHGAGTKGSAPEGAGTHPLDEGGATLETGGGEAHTNMPPWLAVHWIVKF